MSDLEYQLSLTLLLIRWMKALYEIAELPESPLAAGIARGALES